MSYSARRIAPILLLAFAPLGCADDTLPGTTDADPGTIGAPCQSGDSCATGLVCDNNVCVEGTEPGDVGELGDVGSELDGLASDASAMDASSPDGTDDQDASLGPDTFVSDVPLIDSMEEQDTQSEDILKPEDALSDTVADAIEDAVDWETSKSDCEELGIADDWTGEFSGIVTHDLVIPPEFGVPPDDDLPVSGELTFAIECIDSKFKVDGKLDGFAVSAGENYPFTLNLEGYYNPTTGKLSADIVDGMVLVIIAEVYFTGIFEGELVLDGDGNETFEGTWFGEAAGTNLGELIQGDASAQGTWTATPSVVDEAPAP